MENIKESIFIAFFTTMFLLAVTSLLIETEEILEYNNFVNSSIEGNKYVNQSFKEDVPNKNNMVTYDELISSIMGELSCDVSIDGIILDKNIYNYKLFDFSQIRKINYRKDYEYSTNGQLLEIIYRAF